MNVRPILAISLLTLLVGAPLHAQTTPLSGPDDFSGEEILLEFDDLGLSFGGDVPVVEGVEFVLANGSPAKYLLTPGAREFGPPGIGNINNFTFYPRPYSGLHILLPESVARVGFEMRINAVDDVTISLFSGGALVDELAVPNLGPAMFHFYGFENLAGFDEVLIEAGPVIGTISLDNLSFESAGDSAEVLNCDGFESVRDVLGRWREMDRSERRRWWHFFRQLRRPWKSRLLFARVLDADGVPLTDADLAAQPTARVQFSDAEGSEPVDVTDEIFGDASERFASTQDGDWWVAVPRKRMREPGTYEITMESGDASEYAIDPTCSRTVVRVRHPRWWASRHSWRGHRGDDD